MAVSDLVLLEADHSRFMALLQRLRQDANAKAVYLIDKNGQQLASAGEMEGLDPTSLASLAASLVVALAALDEGADAEKLWEAANCEEDWQADLWGRDPLATERRANRFAAFSSAMRFARLAREA